ncbi:phage major capsid protein, P2 family [uncultured Shewanella sp.]|uniref:phage major capsid protein, P2 family n=1 Tax=uncultured Shewanella sp. TaxID=173975 RepID=UPI00261F7395|nr:phage major capsid protein, P2 family [uncultured Shewanella sp.]
MKTKTAEKFNKITIALAASYGVKSVSEQFNVEPSTEQKLYDAVYESAEFLTRINTALVDDLVGASVIMRVDGGVTGRAGVETDDNAERQTTDVSALDNREYRCYPVECDVHMAWVKMDQWAKFPDFHTRYRNHVKQAIALDIIKIGFHGTSAANKTNKSTNPMLQDVNIGWFELVRRDAPENAISNGGSVKIGVHADADYQNLDQAVHDLVQGIPLEKRIGLVAIVGSDLLADDKSKLYAAQAEKPTEKTKIEIEQVIGTYGSLKAYQVSFFPPRGIMVTSFDNLSHYIQSGSTRISTENNTKKKRVEDYQSRNDCYYVEDLEKIQFIESNSVQLYNAKADSWE